jgi:hypothetical protein
MDELVTHRTLTEDDAEHFMICPNCGQAVDCRDLAAVLHHHRDDHEPLPVN